MDYQSFLESKKHSLGEFGFEPLFIPDIAFDFQKFVIEKAVRKGRIANFLDTGLGKTLIQISIAQNVVLKTNKRVLILTPLAVAFQFIIEAEKIGIDDIEYSKDGKFTKKIVICNYERLHYFNSSDFECLILDESSILKNNDGQIKNNVISFIKKIPYRFLNTATPSPNDFIELGTSSEALGYMGYMDMLGKFFKNNQNSVYSNNRNIGEKFYLKPHAEKDFFAWVNQWSTLVKMPSDIGFSNDRYVLPELIVNKHLVKNQSLIDVNGQYQLFTPMAKSMTEVRHEQKQTEFQRCEKAAELVDNNDISFIWCNTNIEGNLLEKLIPSSINIEGSDSIEKKEEAILWFLGKKCICNSKNFTNFEFNWQNKILCGNQSTQKTGEKNINQMNPKERKEKIKLELLMRIKFICSSITKIINQSTNCQKTTKNEKTNLGESVIKTTEIIEKNVLNCQKSQIIQKQDLRELLNNMVSLQSNIKAFMTISQENAQYAIQKVQMMEKEIDCLLTIATNQIQLEGYCVQNATSELDNLMIASNYLNGQSCTCGHITGVRRMISKSTIMGMGLNLQNCNHTVYFPTWSYEQYYQSIRRFWRFGQTNDVTVDLVISDGQTRVLDAIQQKTKKAIELHKQLTENVNGVFVDNKKEFSKNIIKPSFL